MTASAIGLDLRGVLHREVVILYRITRGCSDYIGTRRLYPTSSPRSGWLPRFGTTIGETEVL